MTIPPVNGTRNRQVPVPGSGSGTPSRSVAREAFPFPKLRTASSSSSYSPPPPPLLESSRGVPVKRESGEAWRRRRGSRPPRSSSSSVQVLVSSPSSTSRPHQIIIGFDAISPWSDVVSTPYVVKWCPCRYDGVDPAAEWTLIWCVGGTPGRYNFPPIFMFMFD